MYLLNQIKKLKDGDKIPLKHDFYITKSDFATYGCTLYLKYDTKLIIEEPLEHKITDIDITTFINRVLDELDNIIPERVMVRNVINELATYINLYASQDDENLLDFLKELDITNDTIISLFGYSIDEYCKLINEGEQLWEKIKYMKVV